MTDVQSQQEFELLVEIIPESVRKVIRKHPDRFRINEVILDLGYFPVLRFSGGDEILDRLARVAQPDIDLIARHIGVFNLDNRAGIPTTLHRISAIRNREGRVVGLTCRIGRAIRGSIELIRDIVMTEKNILLLGAPGSGKTTKLREIAAVLSTEQRKRVIIVDTSNEIAGDGDIPHQSIGYARRMQVPSPDLQHKVMIEAVENHMPQVIIVDEIGTIDEAKAARTIAERGVRLIATAHGFSLENLIKNPTLSDLVGGVQTVILGDEEAKVRGTQKTIMERKALPAFESVVELHSWESVAVYLDVRVAVDMFLKGHRLMPEFRILKNGKVRTTRSDFHTQEEGMAFQEPESAPVPVVSMEEPPAQDSISIFPFGLNKSHVSSAIQILKVPAMVADTISQADMVLTLKSYTGSKTKISQIMQGRQIPMHVIKRGGTENVISFLRYFFRLPSSDEDLEAESVQEIRQVCKRVLSEGRMIDSSPHNSFIRRIQHQIVEEEGLSSHSVGSEPNRRVRVYLKP